MCLFDFAISCSVPLLMRIWISSIYEHAALVGYPKLSYKFVDLTASFRLSICPAPRTKLSLLHRFVRCYFTFQQSLHGL